MIASPLKARAGSIDRVLDLIGTDPVARIEFGPFTQKTPKSKKSTGVATVVLTDGSTIATTAVRVVGRNGSSIAIRSFKRQRPVFLLRLVLRKDESLRSGSLALRSDSVRIKVRRLKSTSVSYRPALSLVESDAVDALRTSMSGSSPTDERARDFEELIQSLEAAASDDQTGARAVETVLVNSVRTPADLIDLIELWRARAATVGPLFSTRSATANVRLTKTASVPIGSTTQYSGTVILYVNGILTDLPNYGFNLRDLRGAVDEALPGADIDGMYQISGKDAEESVLGGVLCRPADWIDGVLNTYLALVCRDGGGAIVDLGQSAAQVADGTFLKIITLGLTSTPGIGQAQELARLLQLHVGSGHNVIVVAHSQGNYFVRDALGLIKERETGAEVLAHTGVIMVGSPLAPGAIVDYLDASRVRLENDYFDFVAELSEPNWNIYTSLERYLVGGLFAHSFSDNYLVGAHRAAIRGDMMEIARSLGPAATDDPVAPLQAILTWNAGVDLDLHVDEPQGTHVSYAMRDGISGSLSEDESAGFGPGTGALADGIPEVYTVSDAAHLQAGTYGVAIDYFAGSGSTSAVLAVRAQREFRIFFGLPFSAVTNSPRAAATVTIAAGGRAQIE
jgi:hypothetical protein